jgi:hypothetical protein
MPNIYYYLIQPIEQAQGLEKESLMKARKQGWGEHS